MILFILLVLSTLIVAFLVMIGAQLIRIERAIRECADIADVKVKRFYGKL